MQSSALDRQLLLVSLSLFTESSDAHVIELLARVVLSDTSCDVLIDRVSGSGTGVTDDLSALESLLTRRTPIALSVRVVLSDTSCDVLTDPVLGGGIGVTDGLSVLESLLTRRTRIGSVELTRLI